MEGLKEIIADYPYFAAARILYLRNLRNLNSYRFETELVKHAIFIPDRKVLYDLLKTDFKPSQEFELLPIDTEAFDRFFDESAEYHLSELHLPDSGLFELIDTPLSSATSTNEAPIDLIDRFIIENPTIKANSSPLQKGKSSATQATSEIDESLITETLAGVYMNQGLYEDALNAYQKLSLKFPEKNSYFATQIEKIIKLISKE